MENKDDTRSLHLMYINEDNSVCDSCDEKGKVAVIETLSGEVIGVCKKCLEKIIKEF